MNRKINIIFFEFLLAVALLFVFATQAHACFFGFGGDCSAPAPDATRQQQNQQYTVAGNQSKMEAAVPIPQLNNSLERENISKRLELFSDPNKVSYIYLISYGKVMAFYTVKGKITSGQKRLTATDRIVDDGDYSTSDTKKVVEAPELDGTFGQSSPYIFFWTTDGTYVQWNGEYMMADQPLQLATPPELVQQVK